MPGFLFAHRLQPIETLHSDLAFDEPIAGMTHRDRSSHGCFSADTMIKVGEKPKT